MSPSTDLPIVSLDEIPLLVEAAFDAARAKGKDDWRRTYEQAPCEYITLIWHWAQCPKEVMLDELDLFMREVLPQLETPDYEVRRQSAQ